MGSIVALAAAAALVWLIVYLVDAEDKNTPTPAVPTDSDFPSFLTGVPSIEPTTTTTPPTTTGEPTRTSKPTRSAPTEPSSEGPT